MLWSVLTETECWNGHKESTNELMSCSDQSLPAVCLFC